MARKTDIRLRRSATSGAIPTASQLNLGELAINTYDGKLFLKKDVGGTQSVIEIGAGEAQNTVWSEFEYTATNNQTTFSGTDNNGNTLVYLTGYIAVYVNGVLQKKTTDYTATSGSSVVLVNGLSSGDILTVHAFAKVLGTGDVTRNTYSGDGSTTAFTLGSDPEGENNLQVFIDGVYQEKSTFSQSGTTLTFSTAPANGTTIEVMLHTRNVSVDNVNELNLTGDLLGQGTSNLSSLIHPHASTLTYTTKVITKTAAHRYNGSGSSSGYTINDIESPNIKLIPGRTYRFDQSDSSNSGHPLRFYYEAAKTTAYTTGVTTNGTAGSSGAYTQIVVSDSTPTVLHYQCSSHGYMGNQVEVASRTLIGFDTDDLSEGTTNKYFANELVDDRVNALIQAGTNITTSYDDAANTLTINSSGKTQEEIEDIVDGLLTAGTGITLTYNDSAGTLTIAGSAQYADSDARAAISVTDSGGDGSLAYNSSTGVITYTGPSAAEVRAHLSAGTGVTYSGGAISIGQAVATNSNVTFADLAATGNVVVTGNLTVNGTQTTVNTATLSVADNIITLNSDETGTPSQNAGIEVERGTSSNVYVTWNESQDRWKFTNDGSTYYNLATSTSDIAEGTNLYYTNARADARIALQTGANLVLTNKDTDDLSEGSTNLYYTDARVSTRADTILNHSNHSNITVSKVGSELRFAAAATYGNSDVETYLDANGTTFPDNVKAQFGTGNDLQISHDGTNSHIVNNTGYMAIRTSTANSSLFLHGDNVHLRSQTGNEAMLTGAVNGALTLYYDNSAKLATTSTGVQTTGTVNVNGAFALPTSDGSSNQVLQTDGSGNVSWATVSASNSSGLVSEAFKNILVSGQSNIVADSATDSLTFAAGSGITLTTNAGTDTLTITNSAVGDSAFKTIAVSGQTSVVADSTTDTLTLVGTNGVDITTNAGTDTITIDGKTSYSPFTTDLFTTANASTTAFVLSKTPSSENNLIVFLEGVYQNKNSYTLSSNTLTLDSAPASGQEVVVHIIGDIVSGEALVRNNFTGDGSTTAFTMTLAPMNENNVYVYSDGVYQEKSEFSVSGTTLTFGSAPASAASLEILIPKATEINQPATASIDDSAMFDQSAIIPQAVTSTTVASTSATTVATHAIATYRSVNYQVQITQGTDYHMTSINVIHDGSTAHFTEYGTVFDNASLATFDATISSGNLLLQVTMGSASSSTIKVISSAVTV